MRVVTRSGEAVTFTVDEAVKEIPSVPYVRWYDALPAGDVDSIALQDLAFPAFLDAVPNFKALLSGCGWESLSRKLLLASERLSEVPGDVDLDAWADSQANRTKLKLLFQSCTAGRNPGFPGFGPARATKLLHKKRPRLVPIVDSWALEAWGRSPTAWSTDDMVDIVFCIQAQMAPSIDEFRSVGQLLKASDSTLPSLSPVRIYDIMFWERSGGGSRKSA